MRWCLKDRPSPELYGKGRFFLFWGSLPVQLYVFLLSVFWFLKSFYWQTGLFVVLFISTQLIQGYSSVGRAAVSKTACRGVKSFCPCSVNKKPEWYVSASDYITRNGTWTREGLSARKTVRRTVFSSERWGRQPEPSKAKPSVKSFCPCQMKAVR